MKAIFLYFLMRLFLYVAAGGTLCPCSNPPCPYIIIFGIDDTGKIYNNLHSYDTNITERICGMRLGKYQNHSDDLTIGIYPYVSSDYYQL